MAEYDGTLRTVHVGLAVVPIVQLLMLMALAATVGLDGAGWAVGLACAVVLYTLLARSLARDGSAGARPGRLGHRCPGSARGRRGGAHRGLVCHSDAGGHAGVARDRRAVPGLRRRLGRTEHPDRVALWRRARRRGRRVPDPDAQPVRRPGGRLVGGRLRRSSVRVPGGGVAVRVDARAAAEARLAKDRDRGGGYRAGDRRRGCPAPHADEPGAGSGAGPAGRVLRPRRPLALEPPTRGLPTPRQRSSSRAPIPIERRPSRPAPGADGSGPAWVSR